MFVRTPLLMYPEPGDSGSTPDRGDDFVPVDPDAEKLPTPEETAAADAAAAKLDAELTPEPEPKAEEEHKKDTRIPLVRHKEILEKEREQRAALEAELAQYKKGGELADMNAELTAAEDAIVEMDKEHAQLLTDGELDKAAALMLKIRRSERSLIEARSDVKIHAAEVRAVERTRYGVALERIENSFPALNEDHTEFDPALMGEVVELKDAYQMKGYTPTVALQKAVRALVELRTTRQEIATSTEPRVVDKDVAAERKRAAVEKTAAATGKTPPSLAEVGMDSNKAGGGKLDAKQIILLNQTDFAKLSEVELSAARGDTL